MPDWGAQTQGQRRANWVSLRTLRQRPKPAGTTEHGDPVYEVRSVRLVLRGDATHFNRLVLCSRCGGEVVGTAVLTPDDLERTPSPVICQTCVRSASVSPPARAIPREVVELDAAPTSVEPPDAAVTGPPSDPLAALEARLDALVEEVAETRAEVFSSREDATAMVRAVDQRMREGLSEVAALMEAQRKEVEMVAAAVRDFKSELDGVRLTAEAEPPDMDDLRDDVAALVESVERGERLFAALEQRLVAELQALRERVERAAAPRAVNVGGTSLMDTLDAQLQAAESRLAARAGAPTIDLLIEPREHG